MSYHALFLSVIAGGSATNLTVFVLFSIDMIMNIFFTFQIVYFKKKNSIKALTSTIQTLLLTETVEVTSPIIYSICFMLAYFGPNADVLGNIQNSYFHYRAVKDVWSSFQNLCILMAIDLLTLIMSIVSIYKYAKINCMKVTKCVFNS